MGHWLDAALAAPCTDWTRQSYAALQPFARPDRYVNYLDDDEPGEEAMAAYGPNYERLRRLKARYDPDNVFHLNHNIVPAV
jgi:FAD/FMN-containing dehydrogenase